ncbi:MAG TPA: ABC transporter permease [Candidatus Dormibacteraeota bacterium]|jgi:ABC-type dipeptide/oligopeptide/nickel transport system permease subunit|nr:ABC transporter permease [Candidatus Dormibacteraeota bacterium]
MATTNVVLQPGVAPEVPSVDFETTKEVGFYQLVWRRFARRKLAVGAMIALGLLALACALGPVLLPAEHVDPTHANLGPLQAGHLLGTDDIGRDLLVRNLSGGRISLAVGGLAMILTISIATLLGALSGFFGGVVDSIVSALTNALLSIPSILILVVFAKAFGQTIQTIVIGISLLAWPYTARIVRAVVLSVREKEFVEAAKALGTPRWRIMMRHLIPNALGPIVVSASLTIGAAILLESALSFLGVGIGQPTATWGSLLNQGYQELNNASGVGFFYSLWPGLLILITVLSFNYIGDALRDAFDPRSLER